MDQVLTTQFWHDQWNVVMSAPWLIIPLLLIAFIAGRRHQKSIDDGEVRGYRADKTVAETRLDLAHDKYETVVQQVAELKTKVSDQDTVIAGLQNQAAPPARVNELAFSNNEIKNLLTSLSTATTNLGATLGPHAGAVYSDTPAVIKLTTKGSG